MNWQFALPAPMSATGTPRFETVLDYTPETGQAHSPGIVVEQDGFQVLWFEGSAEAQSDVDIRGAKVQRGRDGWHIVQQGTVLDRADLDATMEPDQIVVTLGNTIENQAVKGGLFATVASIGGWAMASIVDCRPGRPARKLDLSPFIGRSNLVKSPMVRFADGSMGLPAYFELGSTFGLLARFDEHGCVRDTRRITGAGKPIQPIIVPLTQTRAVAFLRDFDPSHRLLTSRTEDGGQSWSLAKQQEVFNPSSPVAALALGDGRILMAVNDLPDSPDTLRLVLSDDEGDTWRALQVFDAKGALRYPMLRRLTDTDVVLSYSKGNKQGVIAHVFNLAWVQAQ